MGGILLIEEARKDRAAKGIPAIPFVFQGDF